MNIQTKNDFHPDWQHYFDHRLYIFFLLLLDSSILHIQFLVAKFHFATVQEQIYIYGSY